MSNNGCKLPDCWHTVGNNGIHDDVIKWKHFPRYWPFARGIHRSPVNSPHNGQWRGALMFSLICAWINGWVNNREAGDSRRQRAHYDVIVMNRNLYDDIMTRENFTYYWLFVRGNYRSLLLARAKYWTHNELPVNLDAMTPLWHNSNENILPL